MSFPPGTLPGVMNLEYRTPAEQMRLRNEAASQRRAEEEHESYALLGVVLLIVGAMLVKPWLEDKRYL
ncbi:MAG TPA: hypothetical protein VF528_09770 [Pyrinomonadaceae bacterium]